jgi:hypothetical protein
MIRDMNKMQFKGEKWTKRLILGMFILMALLAIGSITAAVSGYGNKQAIKTTVTGKERIISRDGRESYYLIFTEAGTFKLEDDLFYGNFNSSDWYGSIHQDSTYEFQTVGYRNGLLSMYPNIVKIKW